ncbi:MAG: restriction endonuclease [Chloroflexi bacterium]|nr:restriction endonuclease [Chloroflexota bacterium]
MAVPSKKDLHRPILEIADEFGGKVHRREIRDLLIQRLALTDADLSDKSASGSNRFRDRYSFACHDLKLSGLLNCPERGYREITTSGREFLKDHEGVVTDWDLRQLQSQPPPDQTTMAPIADAELRNPETLRDGTPKEVIDAGYNRLHASLVVEMLENIVGVSPDQFERLVVDLLEKMGYGQGRTVGRSGDGGIDGIISQDALGLEKVYIQAKRYTTGSVGEPPIRNFAGSMIANGATKGVFITTAAFSDTAKETAANVSRRNETIRLVDGQELAQLMIRHGVGVVTEYTYEIKKLDENYFAEEI